MILNVIMIFVACCAAGAWLVTWVKLDEQKQKTKDERDRRWDEISRAVELENELEQEKSYFEACLAGNHVLQDRLSALLCPRNDHVWKDGICIKCGREEKK